MRISARWFAGVGWRGELGCGHTIRYTLKKFDDSEEAQLYTLKAVLKLKGIFG